MGATIARCRLTRCFSGGRGASYGQGSKVESLIQLIDDITIWEARQVIILATLLLPNLLLLLCVSDVAVNLIRQGQVREGSRRSPSPVG
jgi:hypothetical protein